jgi:hypothetical protein
MFTSVIKIPTTGFYLQLINPIHIVTPYFLVICFNVILQYTPRSPKLSLPLSILNLCVMLCFTNQIYILKVSVNTTSLFNYKKLKHLNKSQYMKLYYNSLEYMYMYMFRTFMSIIRLTFELLILLKNHSHCINHCSV